MRLSPCALSRRRNVFTLLELLAVITVVLILLSLLLPALKEARSQTQTVVCVANMKQLGCGLITYTVDSHGYLPTYAGSSPSDLSLVREWFRFAHGYLWQPDFDADPDLERRQIWALGRLVPAFDCPTTNELTNYGYQGSYPKTFDYRLSAHWKEYSVSQPATGIGNPIARYNMLPANGIWLIDSASKAANQGQAHEPMTGQEYPTYDLYPAPGNGGVYTSWFYTNTSTAYSDWPFTWTSPQLGNYSGNNYFSPGIHHRLGAVILRPDGSAARHRLSEYLPELENPLSWRSMGRLVAGRVVD